MKYQHLDDLIIARVKAGHRGFRAIFAQEVDQEATRLNRKNADRLVDRRLQSLRKRGILEYTTMRGWHLLEQQHDAAASR